MPDRNQRFERTITPDFNRAADRDTVRKEEIEMKSQRLREKAAFAYERRVAREYQKQIKQTYTPDDVKKLEKREFVPIWAPTTTPVVGAPKSSKDAQELAEIAQDPMQRKHNDWIERAAYSMDKGGKPLGNGVIVGHQRGGDHRNPTS